MLIATGIQFEGALKKGDNACPTMFEVLPLRDPKETAGMEQSIV